VNVNWHEIGLKQVVLSAWLWQMTAGFFKCSLIGIMGIKKIVLLCIIFSIPAFLYAGPGNYMSSGYKFCITEYPPKDSGLILVPFEFKRSALYDQNTFEVIDSVVNLLFKDEGITISILGYSHFDEGSDTICKYLASNRAGFVRDYILGRGISESRLLMVKGMGKTIAVNTSRNKYGHPVNCRVELKINYPEPPPPIIYDRDEDGIADSTDACADKFGYRDNNGCPDTGMVIVPFENQQSYLSSFTYSSLDSVVAVLKQDVLYTISIQGHAFRKEGVNTFCENLAMERADIVKRYLVSRHINPSRITAVTSFGNRHPLNAGKNPQEILQNARVQLYLKK
jgi:outer membrane protein OmpA-like peptidoglycan-associated protein